MTETVGISLLGNIVTLLVTTGGWTFGYLMHIDAKPRKQLEKMVR